MAPNERTTVKELRALATLVGNCKNEDVALVNNEQLYDNYAHLLKDLGLTANSTVTVAYHGVECSSCMGIVLRSSLRDKITKRCEHGRTVCCSCTEEWITSKLEENSWGRITCPECDQRLHEPDMKIHAPRHIYDRWENIASRTRINAYSDMRWCQNPRGCNYGHRHNNDLVKKATLGCS